MLPLGLEDKASDPSACVPSTVILYLGCAFVSLRLFYFVLFCFEYKAERQGLERNMVSRLGFPYGQGCYNKLIKMNLGARGKLIM